jgi:hypothetical protein
MPANDDLEVIRELLTGKPPSQDVNNQVRGRLAAVMAAEPDAAAGRPLRRGLRPHRTVAEVVRRPRRLAWRSAAAVAALAAGAVAVVAVVVPGPGGSADAATYTVKRVDGALSAADPGEIAQMTVTTRGTTTPGGATVTNTAEEWSFGGRWRLVTYSSAGHLVYDEGSTAAPVYTLVSYPARTWARQPGLGRPPGQIPAVPGNRGCQPVFAALPLLFDYGLPAIRSAAGSLPSTVARDLRAAVSCGTLAMAGRHRIDGIEAIELTSRPGSLIPETIWVSAGTYLPLRVVVRPAFGTQGVWQTANITWLPPTAQNLARLIVPVPAGFRHVPLLAAVRPILQGFPAAFSKGPANKVICLGPDGPTCTHGTSGFRPSPQQAGY